MRALALIFGLCSIFLTSASWAQTTIAPGDWNVPGIWNTGVVPNAASGAITINHAVNIPSGYSVTIDQTTISATGSLTIDNGGTLSITNGTGTDLDVQGTLAVNGTLINENLAAISGTSGANTNFFNGSVFTWQYTTTEGTPPLASWASNSTFNVTGYTTARTLTSPNWSQQFGNFTWNCTGQTGVIGWGELITNITGNLTVASTGSQLIRFSDSNNLFLNIAGDLNISGTARVNMGQSAASTRVDIGGNFNFTSTQTNGSFTTLSGTALLNITGNLVLNATSTGKLRLGSSGTGNTEIVLGGDLLITSGILDEGGATTFGLISFKSGGGKVHQFVNPSSTNMRGTVSVYVGPNDVLDVGASSVVTGVNGTGVNCTFTLEGTLWVRSTDALGAIRAVTTGGNIRTPVANRVYADGSTIIYKGAAAQFIGNGHPTNNVNVIIDNSNGVSLAAASVTIAGNLTLQTGNLNVASTTSARVLIIGGNVTSNGGFITYSGSFSDLTINGAGNLGVFPFLSGAQTMRNLTVNRSGGSVTFDNNVTVTAATRLQAGDLIINNRSLTMNGTFASTGGFLSSNNASTISVGGSGAFGTLVFSNTGNSLNTLNFTRGGTGTATIDGALTITSALNLTAGSLTNNGGLTMGNGATLTRNSSGRILVNRPLVNAGESYNVAYTGTAVTTALELPLATDLTSLNSLTVNGGQTTLSQNIVVNGDVNLNSSTLSSSSFTITMQGAQWNDNGGTFAPGTGTVIFNGTTTIGGSSDPLFGNLQLNSGKSITLPSGNVTISGNIQINAGGTVNANGGTVTLTGSSLQTIAGGGATFNNLTVNKTTRNVQLSSALNLTGALNIQSATVFITSSLLTLISTSDDTSGNASVAALLNGASVLGDVTVQRYMSAEGRIWRYISSPITNAPVVQLQDDFPVTGKFLGASICSGCLSSSPSLYYYNGATSKYIAFPTTANTELLTPGRGYSPYIRQDILSGPVTIDFTGPINQGTVVLPVAFNAAAAQSWNLVGNPFPSSIDWDNATGWSKSNISGTVAVRDNGAGGVFSYWDGAVGTLTNGEIAAGQGFWVRATAASPSLSINEQGKTNATAAFLRESTAKPTDVFSIQLKSNFNNVLYDNAYIRIRPESSEGVDMYDAPKMQNDYMNLSSQESAKKSLAINAVPSIACGMTIPLELTFEKDTNGAFLVQPYGDFTFTFDFNGQWETHQVILKDAFTGTNRTLATGDQVTFAVTTDSRSFASDRFSLVLEGRIPNTAVTVNLNDWVCAGSSATLTIPQSEALVSYEVWSNDAWVATFAGGGTIAAILNPNVLTSENNVIKVKVISSCGQPYDIATRTITVVPLPQVTGQSARTCGPGNIVLSVSSNNSVASYNWYIDEADNNALPSHESTLTVQDIQRTHTYYVAGVTTNGCEGPRVPVIAEVAYVIVPVVTWTTDGALEADQREGLQWYRNGALIPGATDYRYTPSQSGSYYVTAAQNDCLVKSNEYNYVEVKDDGVRLNAQVVSLYPNPLGSTRVVTLEIPGDGSYQAALYNSQGVKVMDFALRDAINGQYGLLDLSHVPAGLYFVRVEGQGNSTVIKLSKE